MGRAAGLPLATALCTGILAAQPPAINQEGVFNAASRMPPSLPGGALAPGSRIVIEGLRFEPGSEVRLGDTRLKIVSSAPTRIEALLPGTLAPGPVAIVVGNRDGASRPFAVRIATSSFGFYSTNGKSWGPARMERPFLLTGTGLAGERRPEIFVGGRRTRPIRAGPRQDDPGVDEIEFAPPRDAPEGCFVPVLARLPNGTVSNTVAIPLGHCDPPEIRGDTFLLLARILARIRPYSLHSVDFTQDFGAAAFASEPAIATLLNAWRLLPPPGTCTAYTGKFYGDVGESTLPGFFSSVVGAQGREAGKAVTIRGQDRESTLPPEPNATGFYSGTLGIDKPLYRSGPPLFLSPGDYTFLWTGGSARLAMPPAFTWSNASRLDALDRAAGVNVEWRGGSALRMGILAVSVNPDTTAMGACFCLAAGAEGRFRIPPEMLANLPPTPREPGLPMSLIVLAPLPELHHEGSTLSLAATIRAQSVSWR